ncbi:MAG: hemerythrin family protein [Candidatus Adiutrix sp.]|jgi:hemerythrin-like metal-binding protein|nr:hemerythrin family protein [Candidatus Adiutrix sp.]
MTHHGQGHLLIVWHEPHLTGIKILDEQHRGIVSIINALHYSLFTRHDTALLRPTADMIMGYTKIHFITEMEFLEVSGYPKLEDHQRRHDRLIAEANRIFLSCVKDGGDPNMFLDFLKDWWRNHITTEDFAYGEHVLGYLQSHHWVIKKKG